MLVKNLRNILAMISFDVKDSFYKVLIDDNTSIDYCLTKAMETLHHMRSGAGFNGADFVTLIRILIIAFHKYKQYNPNDKSTEKS